MVGLLANKLDAAFREGCVLAAPPTPSNLRLHLAGTIERHVGNAREALGDATARPRVEALMATVDGSRMLRISDYTLDELLAADPCLVPVAVGRASGLSEGVHEGGLGSPHVHRRKVMGDMEIEAEWYLLPFEDDGEAHSGPIH